ncbi:MAG: non-canonical purine NTP diphosphatase [Bacteroidetes bacterium]|nr:non-canonical purine NTP diphosphatase [Bacteroidota bacterium]
MKTKLVFATDNLHKLHEIQQMLGDRFELLSLKDIGCNEDIPEDHDTLEENARQKSRYVYEKYKMNCFADDTGLETEALDGRPGALSARFAGDEKNPEANIDKLLEELREKTNRKARFRTVISLVMDNAFYEFEGIVNGEILAERHGTSGFGYDPVFLPEGKKRSFAEMPLAEKNLISHRGRAFRKLVEFLRK